MTTVMIKTTMVTLKTMKAFQFILFYNKDLLLLHVLIMEFLFPVSLRVYTLFYDNVTQQETQTQCGWASVLDNDGKVRVVIVNCRASVTTYVGILPFGQQLRIDISSSSNDAYLNIHEVVARGRPYTSKS
jgi:hypothetical protein